MQFTLKQSDWNALSGQTAAYFAELGAWNDGFHHDLMFTGDPLAILVDGEISGFAALIPGWDGGRMLTAFYLAPGLRALSADILSALLADFELTGALVPSNDANLVSIAFEKMRALGTGFEMQAYNHVYGEPKRPAEFGADCFEQVSPAEYEQMNALTDKQWDFCISDPAFRFFAIRRDGETLGYGAACALRNRPGFVDIGNFTLPQHRQKGVGRSMLIHLAQLVRSEGMTPVAGCWYGNKESIPTLKSSGFVPANRIFYVKFK